MITYSNWLDALNAAIKSTEDVVILMGNMVYEYNIAEIYQAYATELDKDVDSLTDWEKRQAMLNYFLAKTEP